MAGSNTARRDALTPDYTGCGAILSRPHAHLSKEEGAPTKATRGHKMKEIQYPWALWPERKKMLCRIRDLGRSLGIAIDIDEIAQLPFIDLVGIEQQLAFRDHWDSIGGEDQ